VVERSAVERGAVERSAVERGAVERSAVERSAVERSAVERSAVEDGRAYGDPAGSHRAAAALAALAARQHGVVSVEQLRSLGFCKHAVRRAVERNRLLRVGRGVYAVGYLRSALDSRRMAAVLACGPGALLSHQAGAALQRLLPSSPQLHVTVPHGRAPRAGLVVHRSRLIHPEDRDVVRGIPVTSVARTLVDLAEDPDEQRLAKAVHEAEVQRRFDLHAIERVLDRLPGRAGRHRVARVLAAYRPHPNFTRSEAERRFLDLCKRHGLPRPQTNVWIGGQEVDAYWHDVGVVVQIDGAESHHTRRAFHDDRARDRRLAALGARVVRVTWVDLEEEARLAAELRAVRGAGAPAAGSRPAPAFA
jgi:predicted transcriptional regulator of viral defense system/very-short-patch-repair endonuclease